jgi:hypothetical protein
VVVAGLAELVGLAVRRPAVLAGLGVALRACGRLYAEFAAPREQGGVVVGDGVVEDGAGVGFPGAFVRIPGFAALLVGAVEDGAAVLTAAPGVVCRGTGAAWLADSGAA